VSGGPMLDMKTPWGEVEIAGALSVSHGQSGGAGWFAYSYVTQAFSIGGNVRAMSSQYSNLSLTPSDDRAKLQASIFTSFQLNSFISVFPQYTYTDDRDNGSTHQLATSLSFRVSKDIAVLVTANHTLQPGSPSTTDISISLNYFLGGSTNASLTYNNQSQGSTTGIAVQKALPVGPGFGYRAQAQTGAGGNQFDGDFLYQSTFGLYEFDYLHGNGQDQTMLNLSGGLVMLGERIFLSRAVQDGFALIRVPGVENVSAYLSNQYMGRTDSRGDLLLPNMLPYYGNQVRINDKDIPLDHAVDAMLKTVAPPLRGGAVINFPVHRVQAFVGKLKISAIGQTIIPKLGELKVNTAEKVYTSPIGNAGEFYLENIAPGKHAATIQYEDGECRFIISLPDSTNQFVKLGTLVCAASSIAATETP